jgi:ABC-2 type transport system ATP-binding protein
VVLVLGCAILSHGISKRFRKRTRTAKCFCESWALRDVSFEIGVGEAYGLLGPNGSGKSSMIRILSTLLIPDAGHCEIMGLRLPTKEREVRRLIGRVGSDAAYYRKLSVRENLIFGGSMYGLRSAETEARSLQILERIGFDIQRYNNPMQELSRGMQQKVSIARATLANPAVLLLDEPTTGLDPTSRRSVWEFIEELRKTRGTTVLVATHMIDEADHFCDRIGILVEGRLIEDGSPREMRERTGEGTLEEAFVRLTGGDTA